MNIINYCIKYRFYFYFSTAAFLLGLAAWPTLFKAPAYQYSVTAASAAERRTEAESAEKKVDRTTATTIDTRPDGEVIRTEIHYNVATEAQTSATTEAKETQTVESILRPQTTTLRADYSLGASLVLNDLLTQQNRSYELTGGYRLFGPLWSEIHYTTLSNTVAIGLRLEF